MSPGFFILEEKPGIFYTLSRYPDRSRYKWCQQFCEKSGHYLRQVPEEQQKGEELKTDSFRRTGLVLAENRWYNY